MAHKAKVQKSIGQGKAHLHIALPKDILQRLKISAIKQGVTLKTLCMDALERELQDSEDDRRRAAA